MECDVEALFVLNCLKDIFLGLFLLFSIPVYTNFIVMDFIYSFCWFVYISHMGLLFVYNVFHLSHAFTYVALWEHVITDPAYM